MGFFKKKQKVPMVRVVVTNQQRYTEFTREMVHDNPEEAVSKISRDVSQCFRCGQRVVVSVPGCLDVFAIDVNACTTISVSLIWGTKT